MRKKEQLNSIIEICPVRNVVARFGNKWALLVILVISENEPIRYNELGRKIPDISSRVLSNTLRILEADGLINRQFLSGSASEGRVFVNRNGPFSGAHNN